jgi:hypothetical protein
MVAERQALTVSKKTDDRLDKSRERERKETSSVSFSTIFFHTDCNALPSVSPVCTVCSWLLLVYAVPC